MISKNSYRSCLVSAELLAISPTITCSIMPLDHRPIPPCTLKRDVRFRHWHRHLLSAPHPPYQNSQLITCSNTPLIFVRLLLILLLVLHVTTCANLNKHVHSVSFRDGINGSLDRFELAGPININGDYTVADGSNPHVMVLSRICSLSCGRDRNLKQCKRQERSNKVQVKERKTSNRRH